ncbi:MULTISPECIES: type II secretory pathway protein [unclassified Undibacterium]|uniref:type II secretion system protein GspD n=2 Tax=Pseudomonadota TaxID=1224 RepID=UPI002AC946F2|nr:MULTISPECIES: type II secretory pathway protein [unclassified Undibacterium]MEB0137649.1 type II secretory pathway protein [Undibacterium sp. CCC2.1]MEB0170650.1 type II secretory pathway protein [Undibacterium sp. CCC1.1]MEB0174591.1 type II secretory pathway protein [Undibacterium sp. CCC3.4]MEB0213611.1 type II secretory pathway protein [Undibacterium sp. 5I2]WPX43779.1 type II secretory pathway protein [Undibacterium sp. CCC3.4]
MKNIFFVVLLLSSVLSSAQEVQSISNPANISRPYVQTSKVSRFDFQSICVAQVIQLIYSEALKTPYVLDPEILTDGRLVSFRYANDKGDLKIFLQVFLESLGYSLESHSGIDFVAKRKVDEKAEIEPDTFVYRPKFREVTYLARLLSPLFKGSFSVNHAIAAPDGGKVQTSVPSGSAASLIDQSGIDILMFSGPGKEIERLKKLLPQVDFVTGEVLVRSVVYEVSTSEKDGSAFGLLTNILGGKLNIGIGAAMNTGNFVQFKNATLDVIYSALSSDSRFKVVSSPSLRIRSGSKGTFSVGQDVPVLGAISYPTGAGQAVQSVEYRSSGVLFDIQPVVHESVIDLNIDQQLSNFVTTTTGVNNSPTLIKRALKTTVSMQDGDLIILGGLTENKESGTHDGLSFLPKFMHTKGTDNSRSEILLILQIQQL